MYDSDYVEEKETKHHQLRWVITTEIGGVVREQEFAHPLAAQDALVIAGQHRASDVPPRETLRRLRMLAYESLESAKQLTAGELEELRIIHGRHEERDHHRRTESFAAQPTERERTDPRPKLAEDQVASDSAGAAAGDGAEDDAGLTQDAEREEQE